MIICIGEMLADITVGETSFVCVGGAPFNVAVAAKKSGAEVAFIGKVGDDAVGKYLKASAERFGLDRLVLQADKKHNTTLAFVTVTDGERDFSFFRKNTADYRINITDKLLDGIKGASIIHVGSLMLNEKCGVAAAEKVFAYAKERSLQVSFDVNYRGDLFSSPKAAFEAYAPFIVRADIVKFSSDELELYLGKPWREGIKELNNTLVCVTDGSNGSTVKYGGKTLSAATEKVVPVDTTGAGDAYFGTFLAEVEKVGLGNLTIDNLLPVVQKANKAGGEATLYRGAVRL